MSEPTEQEQPSEGTVEQPKQVTAPSTDAGKDSTLESSNTSLEVNVTENRTSEQVAAERGKISALEKKNNELTKQAEELKGRSDGFDVLEGHLRDNPTAYEIFRQDYLKRQGVDIGTHSQRFSGQVDNSPTEAAPAQGQSQAGGQPITINQVRETIRVEKELDAGLQEFIKAVPNMDPYRENLTDEDAGKIQKDFDEIASVAFTLRQTDKYKHLSQGQALIRAHNAMNLDQQVEQAKADGETVGKLSAYASNTGVSQGVTGSRSAPGSNSVSRLNDEQKARYDRLVARGKQDVADIFIKKALNE